MMHRFVLIVVVSICCAVLPASADTISFIPTSGVRAWNDTSNWNLSRLPDSEDDVSISGDDTLLVTLASSDVFINSLNQTGGKLDLNYADLNIGASGGVVNGQFNSANRSRLYVYEGTFTVNGPTTIKRTGLFAYDGGKLILPNFTSYDTQGGYSEWVASGEGSQLDLSGLQHLTTSVNNSGWGLALYTEFGAKAVVGNISLDPSVTAPGELVFDATDEGSMIDLRAVRSLEAPGLCGGLSVWGGAKLIVSDTVTSLNGGSLTVSSSGVIERADGTNAIPRLTSLSNGYISVLNEASPDLSGLTDISGSRLFAFSGGELRTPNVSTLVIGQNYQGKQTGLYSWAYDGGVIDLSSIQTIQADGQWSSLLKAYQGGCINLKNVKVIPANGFLDVLAEDAGTVIDLSSLTQVNSDARIVVKNGAKVLLGSSVNFGGTHDLQLSGGSIVTGMLPVAPDDTLAGTGTIQADVVNAGRVAPGSSPGLLTIDGDYTQTSEGVLAMEVAGADAGTGYDVLNVTGRATLDGLLELSVLEDASFELMPGMEFGILQSNGLSGIFQDLPDGSVAWRETGGDGDQLFIFYTDHGVVLRTSLAAVPEPTTWALVLLGSLGLVLGVRRGSLKAV